MLTIISLCVHNSIWCKQGPSVLDEQGKIKAQKRAHDTMYSSSSQEQSAPKTKRFHEKRRKKMDKFLKNCASVSLKRKKKKAQKKGDSVSQHELSQKMDKMGLGDSEMDVG